MLYTFYLKKKKIWAPWSGEYYSLHHRLQRQGKQDQNQRNMENVSVDDKMPYKNVELC